MSWSSRSKWQRIRLVLGWTLVTLFLLAATFPLWNKSIGIGHSLRIDRGLAEVRALYAVADRYRSEHDGRNPPTIDALKPYTPVQVHMDYDDFALTLADLRSNYRYDHSAKGEQALFTSRIDDYAAVWVTASGRAYAGRLRPLGIIWPRWTCAGDSRQIRWSPALL